MYQATEMATAVKYQLNLVNIVFNNHAYGNVRRDQQENFGGNVIGSDLYNPDFVRFAESFGARGFHVETPGQLRVALQTAFKETGPTLIEMRVSTCQAPGPISCCRASAPVTECSVSRSPGHCHSLCSRISSMDSLTFANTPVNVSLSSRVTSSNNLSSSFSYSNSISL